MNYFGTAEHGVRAGYRTADPATAAVIIRGLAGTAAPATRTLGVALTPSPVARAVTYPGQSRYLPCRTHSPNSPAYPPLAHRPRRTRPGLAMTMLLVPATTREPPGTVQNQQLNGPFLVTPAGTPRARALGIPFGGTPGRWNAITDVPGAEVGYQTIIAGDAVRTGVTGIHPRGRAGALDPVAAGFFSQNGNGELTGASWVEESGTCSLPIAITNTHAVGIAHAGIIAWAVRSFPELGDDWALPVAGETWDGYLNDINGHRITEQDCIDALDRASSGPLAEGSVGGGTGMICYGFKGGNGTASRLVSHAGTEYTVGVFVQANFGSRQELVLAGRPLGRLLADDDPVGEDASVPPGAGSVIAIVLTDAPLLPHQCKALARRVTLGLARTGTTGSHSSGDLFLACSTANPGGFSPYSPARPRAYDQLAFVPWDAINPFFAAVVQGVEEAVANALCAGEEMTGRAGHRVPGLPRDRVAGFFRVPGA